MYDTLTLEDTADGKTLMRSHSRFQYPEDAPAAMATGMAEGGAETWERLAELVAAQLAAA